MSHTVAIKTQVKSLRALEDACAKMGLTFVRDAETYKVYAGDKPCAHRIEVPNARYSVGVVAQEDGTFKLMWDPYDSALPRAIGQDACKLRQGYSVAVVREQALRKGLRVEQKTLEDGKVRISLTVAA